MTIPEHLRRAYLATILVTWDREGLPLVLSGPSSVHLPARRVHVVTAWDPEGRPGGRDENATAHRRLIDGLDAAGVAWAPAVGAAPDGSHHELGIVTDALARTQAVALGAEHRQLAVFELDEEQLLVLPCDGGAPLVGERRDPFGQESLTYDHLRRWRAEHEEMSGRRLARTWCPACGAPDPRRIQYGMPATMPPDWIDLGGCCVGPDFPHRSCPSCGHRWSHADGWPGPARWPTSGQGAGRAAPRHG